VNIAAVVSRCDVVVRMLCAGTLTALNNPVGVSAYDASGTFYVSDTGNRVLRRVFPNGTTSVVAGTLGVSGNTLSLLNFPRAITLVGNDVVIADSGAHVIRVLYPNGTLSTLFGVLGSSAYSGDGGFCKCCARKLQNKNYLQFAAICVVALNARLNNVYAAVSDKAGGLLIRCVLLGLARFVPQRRQCAAVVLQRLQQQRYSPSELKRWRVDCLCVWVTLHSHRTNQDVNSMRLLLHQISWETAILATEVVRPTPVVATQLSRSLTATQPGLRRYDNQHVSLIFHSVITFFLVLFQ
jgi:hypothetical protein